MAAGLLLERRGTTSAARPSFHERRTTTAAAILTALATGFAIGRYSRGNEEQAHPTLPDGLPRACCEAQQLTDAQEQLPAQLRSIVGTDNVLDGRIANTTTLPFLRGARPAAEVAPALCIVTPRKLHDVQRVVEAAVAADCVIVAQGQNTGLTGGSVPRPGHRPVVLLSLPHLTAMFPIDNGERMVCFAGVGLASVRAILLLNVVWLKWRKKTCTILVAHTLAHSLQFH